ncbi:hypothetical protein [Actinomadura rayongensis]|uniref:Uncharacterized protein n=1 Tax=Actinomadura rayongensis TaxID=1429076 RepID=A0A6I4WCW0_9ACTN|nr:hypothetical protein [Actinomadura rayongensis]MXQ65686.1 hypothetical protein [Actinomadura rayongensis]
MFDDLIRGLQNYFDSERLAHLGMHALQHFIKETMPHLWGWAKDNLPDILDQIREWF